MAVIKGKVKGVVLIDAGSTSYKNEKRDCVVICRIGLSRMLSGYTQKELADYCCVSKNSISSIERGEYCPSSILLMKISIYLQESPDYLFQLIDPEFIGDDLV